MTIQRLKSIIYDKLIPQGFSMCFESPTMEVLDELIEIAISAKKELKVTQDNELRDSEKKDKLEYLLYKLDQVIISGLEWADKYAECWKIKHKMFELTSFDWYEPDIDYEDDVLAFYQAAKQHIEDL